MPLAVPGESEIVLPDSRPWLARIESAAYWADSVQIQLAKEPVEVSFKLFPLARVRVSVTVGSGGALPAEVEVTFAQALHDGSPLGVQVPEGTVTCELNRSDALCGLPAGQLDLRFVADGFAPVYFWSLTLDAAKVSNLGNLAL